ncbi:MAG: M14 family metallopeptidase [Anaerolineales bacterium]
MSLLLTACAAAQAEPLPTLAVLNVPQLIAPTLPSEWTPTPFQSPTATNTRPPATATPTATVTPIPPPSGTVTRTSPPPLTPPPGDVAVIGHSLGNRPLEMYKFGSGPVEKLIIFGIHGGYEYNTVLLAHQLIEMLNANPDFVPPDVTLYLLRVLNADGFARSWGVDGQMNDRGVDLNRNWPSKWKADWPRSGCWIYRPVNGGEHPLSEPETKALAEFILQHNFDASLSYHSAALGIFAGGTNGSTPTSIRLAEAVADASGYAYPPFDTGCEYTGQFSDWAADQGIAALDVELTNHRDTDFDTNLRLLQVFLNWRH